MKSNEKVRYHTSDVTILLLKENYNKRTKKEFCLDIKSTIFPVRTSLIEASLSSLGNINFVKT